MLSKDGIRTVVHVVVVNPTQTNPILKVSIFKGVVVMIATWIDMNHIVINI